MGFSLRALLGNLPTFRRAPWMRCVRFRAEPALRVERGGTVWQIEPQEAVIGYLWAWAENQVLVAMKAVPSVIRGQRVLLAIGSRIAQIAAQMGSGNMASETGASKTGASEMKGMSSGSNFCPALPFCPRNMRHNIRGFSGRT